MRAATIAPDHIFLMSTDTTTSAGSLRGTDGYMPFDVRVTSLAVGQELLTGVFKDTGSRHLPDRPFRIVIHDGFYHAKLGVYSWRELNLQMRDTRFGTIAEKSIS